jgi:hypothetical protein
VEIRQINTGQGGDRNGREQEGKGTAQIAAEIIRSRSESGQLVSREEIFQNFLNRRLLNGDEDEAQNLCEVIIKSALEENEDLVRLHTMGPEPHFFSSRFMSEAYARILMRKESDLLLLIAEFVRQDSAIFPRPVPQGAFENSPFDLSKEEIQRCLSRMADRDEYQDIKQTRSSIGTVFLYSTLHLEPGYAAMLAEWVDVGQASNP